MVCILVNFGQPSTPALLGSIHEEDRAPISHHRLRTLEQPANAQQTAALYGLSRGAHSQRSWQRTLAYFASLGHERELGVDNPACRHRDQSDPRDLIYQVYRVSPRVEFIHAGLQPPHTPIRPL